MGASSSAEEQEEPSDILDAVIQQMAESLHTTETVPDERSRRRNNERETGRPAGVEDGGREGEVAGGGGGDADGEGEDAESGEEAGAVDSDEEEQVTRYSLFHLFTSRRAWLSQQHRKHASHVERKRKVYPSPVPMEPSCDFYKEMVQCSSGFKNQILKSHSQSCTRNNICSKLYSRQLSLGGLTQSQRIDLTEHMMPRHPCLMDVFTARVFCGTYNREGTMFISAVQDNRIYLYNSTTTKYEEYKSVSARDVGWSILDVVFSPDQYWIAYSTWSDCVYVCNVYGEEEKHFSLDLRPDMFDRFCVFSLRFSSDGKELITACSDGYIYIYNREISDRTLKIDAHQDDADAVALDDHSPQIIFSAGDDGLCKVWDRRCLSESHPQPVGCLAGHKDGITFIDTKGDGRHLITNSKDQTIKLWDIRKFSKKEAIDATLSKVQHQSWDYRWQDVPRRAQRDVLVRLPGDSSIMTYVGHQVKHTLLRARFSPLSTTGQKYIYTACAKGRVLVYDALTGEVVKTLVNDRYTHCVRDVSWHPTRPAELVTSSWSGVLQLWTHNKQPDLVNHSGRNFILGDFL